MVFQSRTEAGKKLVSKLVDFQGRKDLVVLAIPRGGIVVGKPLSQKLHCSLDIIVVKKISAPGSPELAIGAIGPEGQEAIDEELAARVGADDRYIQKEKAKIETEIARRVKEYRGNRPPLKLNGKTLILTDDGVATGATMLAAIEVIRQYEPGKIVVAVPVIAQDSLSKLEAKADGVVYLDAPKLFFAVGQFYQDFSQVGDAEVREILSN